MNERPSDLGFEATDCHYRTGVNHVALTWARPPTVQEVRTGANIAERSFRDFTRSPDDLEGEPLCGQRSRASDLYFGTVKRRRCLVCSSLLEWAEALVQWRVEGAAFRDWYRAFEAEYEVVIEAAGSPVEARMEAEATARGWLRLVAYYASEGRWLYE